MLAVAVWECRAATPAGLAAVCLAALSAGLSGLQRPALEAMMPELAVASALDGFRFGVAFLAGPLVGGVLIHLFEVKGAYLADVLTFAGSLIALYQVKAMPLPLDGGWLSVANIREGLNYARRRPELIGTYLVDIIAMFFGMPVALLPALSERFGDARALAVLSSAPWVGRCCRT